MDLGLTNRVALVAAACKGIGYKCAYEPGSMRSEALQKTKEEIIESWAITGVTLQLDGGWGRSLL